MVADSMNSDVKMQPINFVRFWKQKTEKKEDRMHNRFNRKCYILYPEDKFKSFWDFIVSCNLLVMCFYTPIIIAFTPDAGTGLLSILIDVIFGIDIIIVFFSAFYDNDFKLID